MAPATAPIAPRYIPSAHGWVVSVPDMTPCMTMAAKIAVGRPVQAPPVLRSDALALREGRVHEHHQLGGHDPDTDPERAVRDEAGNEKPGDADLDGRIEYERYAVDPGRAEAQQGEEAMRVRHGRGLERLAEGSRLEHDPGQHGDGQQDEREHPGGPCLDPERGVRAHASPPTSTTRPSSVTSTAGIPRASASIRAALSPASRSIFAATSASAARSCKRRHAAQRRFERASPVAGSMRWWSSTPPRRQRRWSRPDVASAPLRSPSVRGAAGHLDGHGPDALLGRAVDREVATRVDDARPGNGEQRARPIGDVPLRDAAEVEPVPRLDLDRRTVHGDAATAGSPRR